MDSSDFSLHFVGDHLAQEGCSLGHFLFSGGHCCSILLPCSFLSVSSTCVYVYDCARSHHGVCHIPSDLPPLHLQPLSLYLSPSACMVAGQLWGELSFPGNQLQMTCHGVGGEGEGAPSPCPLFWGHKWSPAPPNRRPPPPLPLFPASLSQSCQAHALGARSLFGTEVGVAVG